MDVDSVYRQLGKPGRYHVVIYVLMCCNYFPVIVNHLVMAIYGSRTGHRCKLPDGYFVNESIPHILEDGKLQLDECHVYKNYSQATNMTVPCPNGWVYELGPRESNIISEWDLVCDRKYMSSLATTIYFSGVMLGGILFGTLSDLWGRKPFMLLTLYSHIVVGVGIAFADSWYLFVTLRFLQGFLMQGLQTCTFVLIMESYASEMRTAAGTVFEVFWGVGVLWLAFVSWLIQNWRYIQLALTLPSCLAIIYIWVMPESVRWLVAHKKYKEAEIVLKRAAKFNGVELPEDPLNTKTRALTQIRDTSTEAGKEEKKYSILDMFRSKELCKRSFIMFYVWFVTAVGYYGLSLSITSLAGNKYLNLFIGGLLELPAYCAAVFILTRFGRRRPLCAYLFIAGVFCITAGTIPAKIVYGVDLRHVSTALAVIGRFGMAGCFSVVLLYTCELYPTVIRNVSMGSCAFWTRVGGMVAPQILYFSQSVLTSLPAHLRTSMPVLIIGGLALLGGLLVLALPETLNKTLADTIQEAELLGKNKAAPPGKQVSNGTAAHAEEEYLLQGPVKKETFI